MLCASIEHTTGKDCVPASQSDKLGKTTARLLKRETQGTKQNREYFKEPPHKGGFLLVCVISFF